MFIRPEAAHALHRWREALTGGGVLIIGLWGALATYGVASWLGWAMVMAGLAFIAAGIQRARFRIPGQGPGMLRVTEGQITYFGPLSGGAIALSELRQIQLDPSGKPAHWVLSQTGQPDLFVPLTAEGAEMLFDAFASLPGMRTEFMLSQMSRTAGDTVLIWQNPILNNPLISGA